MSIAEKTIDSIFDSDESFRKALKRAIKEDLGLTAIDFAEKAVAHESPLCDGLDFV